MSKIKVAAGRLDELNRVIIEADKAYRKPLQDRDADPSNGVHDICLVAEDPFDPLSTPENRHLDGAIYDFIEEAVKPLPHLAPIRVVMRGVPEADRRAIPELVKGHYDAALREQLLERKVNTTRMICMLVIGLVFLAVYLVLSLTCDKAMFLELLSVVSSFALYDAIGCFMLERRIIRRKMLETARFMTMDVAFE